MSTNSGPTTGDGDGRGGGNMAAGHVTLEVGGKLFMAHVGMLACRSLVFKEQLMGPTTMERKNDATPRILGIHDMEPIVFRALLHFIYTDSLPDIAEGQKIEMAKDLLVAADRYRVERLKLICEKMLSGWVDASTVADFLGFAVKHSCKGLNETCLNFLNVRGNLRKFIESDGFEGFARSCPSVLKELLLGTLDA